MKNERPRKGVIFKSLDKAELKMELPNMSDQKYWIGYRVDANRPLKFPPSLIDGHGQPAPIWTRDVSPSVRIGGQGVVDIFWGDIWSNRLKTYIERKTVKLCTFLVFGSNTKVVALLATLFLM